MLETTVTNTTLTTRNGKATLLSLPLLVEESGGLERIGEPVTVGMPFPSGAVFDPAKLRLSDQRGRLLPLQAEVLARWSDDSVKWALLDFQASLDAYEKAALQLQYAPDGIPDSPSQQLELQQTPAAVTVATGATVFFINPRVLKPFDRIVVQGGDILEAQGSRFVLTDDTGREYEPRIQDITVETSGPLRITLRLQGEFRKTSEQLLARFTARLSFFAGSNLVQMQMTLHNPRAAHHPGGLWDLGDEGSIFFKDLSLTVPFLAQEDVRSLWLVRPEQSAWGQASVPVEIYQDSSGGENWRSSNHVNRFGKVMHSFRGYRVTTTDWVILEGERATPVMTVHDKQRSISAAVEKFWQNFPKALEVDRNQLTVRLFPKQYNDVYELQGGEQKTHTVYLQFSHQVTHPTDLRWLHDRLVPRTTPEWYADSGAFSYLVPRHQDRHVESLELVDAAIDGLRSFVARREIIDEYGWRHFGDLYADHEAARNRGDRPLVSHYNNQYDVIYGALVQYMRSGDQRWFELAQDLARHVIDIDIYHTQDDRKAYNGGMFWHTDHYVDAATATHRAYSKVTQHTKNLPHYGGGPANEHNYTTGLLHYHYLTGDVMAREVVQGLAEWVIGMDDGSQRPLGRLDRRPTGFSSSTANRDYHGPGRGAGNSINALLDAYQLSRVEKYLVRAEQLIRRCIHPHDDIQGRNLGDVEHRWSYTVFLQVLGKYLDVKAEQNILDYMYSYARASLLHYAGWMLEHEVPYSQVLDRVDIPTETWPAQDIRKSNVFYLASKFASGTLRRSMRDKAAFFFRACIDDLREYATCTLTRPIVLLMTNAYLPAYFDLHPEVSAPEPSRVYDFGQPLRFTPQHHELYRLQDKLKVFSQVIRGSRKEEGPAWQRQEGHLEGHHG